MGTEIDPRDCQHGWADSQQEEIDSLRAELEAEKAKVAELVEFMRDAYFASDAEENEANAILAKMEGISP